MWAENLCVFRSDSIYTTWKVHFTNVTINYYPFECDYKIALVF